MSIEEYISKYYCDNEKRDLHLNDIKNDSNFIYNYIVYNEFHSVWIAKDANISNELVFVCKTKDDEYKIKLNRRLSNSEDYNFITFEESTIWVQLKYIPFKCLLNQLGYPIYECVEKKDFWWGKLKYQEYKFEKINSVFKVHEINPENSRENNLDLISKILEREGVFVNSAINESTLNDTTVERSGRSPEIIKSTQTLNGVLNGNIKVGRVAPRR